jgi:hypothetical protein
VKRGRGGLPFLAPASDEHEVLDGHEFERTVLLRFVDEDARSAKSV